MSIVILGSCADDAPIEARDPRLSVVRLDVEGCAATPARAVAVVIGADLVATVAHAIAGAPHLTVTGPTGAGVPAIVVAIDPAMDLAVLSAPGLGLPALELGAAAAGRARTVTFPADEAIVVSVTVRRLVRVDTSDIYGDGDVSRPGLELAAAVVPGDSGGAVIGGDGRLDGLIWATSRIEGGRAWATQTSALTPLLQAYARGDAPPRLRCP